ncbi:MAG: hypothetical protein FWD58_02085 [Firmicutes bacterium]|nr:hypothetical protein [Bacillota bacterium]
MDENKRFELAEFLKELRDEKDALEEKIKGLNVDIESVTQELIEDLIANESTGFNYKGFNFSLVVKEYPAPEPERKDELWQVMKEQGFEHLFTINSQTLGATLKELKANNDDIMPEWLDGLVKIAEKSSIRISKGRKV